MEVNRSPIIRCHTRGTVSQALSFVSNIYLLASMSKWSRRSISKCMVSILQKPSSACDSRYLNPTHGRSGGTKELQCTKKLNGEDVSKGEWNDHWSLKYHSSRRSATTSKLQDSQFNSPSRCEKAFSYVWFTLLQRLAYPAL